jgi:hypothetical protein
VLRVWIHRIKPGYETRLQDWLHQLNARASEVRESFAAGGVRAEQAFILQGVTGSLLVYASEAEDRDRAAAAFEASTLAIDDEHRRVMAECLETPIDVAPAYDVAL